MDFSTCLCVSHTIYLQVSVQPVLTPEVAWPWHLRLPEWGQGRHQPEHVAESLQPCHGVLLRGLDGEEKTWRSSCVLHWRVWQNHWRISVGGCKLVIAWTLDTPTSKQDGICKSNNIMLYLFMIWTNVIFCLPIIIKRKDKKNPRTIDMYMCPVIVLFIFSVT